MKRTLSLFLSLACALLLLCPAVQTASAAQEQEEYIAAIHTRNNGSPYYIMVNRAQNTVTVYGLDEGGYYSVPVKAMVCSVGRKGHATPTGTFSIGGRWTWVHMFDDSYGQYCTQIKGNILFHSVCYTRRDPSTLMTAEYNGLGAPASLGCVRLQTVDAKWIYDNCPRGTKVTIYDGEDPGALGKPGKLVEYISDEQANGWDPTDPREANPWHAILAGGGDPAPSAEPSPEPLPSAEPSPEPLPSAEASPAPSAGPVSQPIPEDTDATYLQAAQALYGLSGETGLTQPMDIVLWAARQGLLKGITDGAFNPLAPISRQDLASMLYRYETDYCRRIPHNLSSTARFTDWPAISQYARFPVRWAAGNGLMQDFSGLFQPGGRVTCSELDETVRRCAGLHA